MFKAFLFDLDGVLTDTSEFHFLAWQRLAPNWGFHSPGRITRRCAEFHGVSR